MTPDRLVFKTIIQPRTLLSRRVVIGSGVYTLAAIIVVGGSGSSVRRVLIWALAIGYCCCWPRCCSDSRKQVVRLKPVVIVGAAVSPWPCCYCYGSGGGGVALLLLVT